jgi:SAM-dependent methyltransferase
MVLYVPKFDTSLMPIHTYDLSEIPRVPLCELEGWGVRYDSAEDFLEIERRQRKGYEKEWVASEGQQMQTVSDASIKAGFGDIPQVLRDAAGVVTRHIVDQRLEEGEKTINILDNGCGPGLSAKTVFSHLSDYGKEAVRFLLLDPSPGKLKDAEKNLKGTGMRYKILPAMSDYDMVNHIKPGFLDIIVNVAGGKHHALVAAWSAYKSRLKKGGFFLSEDWDADFWKTIIVYDLCMSFDWPDKEKFDHEFRKTYLNKLSLDDYRKLAYPQDPVDAQGINDMGGFWTGYGMLEIANKEPKENSIWIPEGHMHPRRVIGFMEAAGLRTDTEDIRKLLSKDLDIHYKIGRKGEIKEGSRRLKTNPHYICPDSSLWSQTIGQNDY